jgi:hypothetical protein
VLPEPQNKQDATNGDQWIAVRVTQASEQQPLVTNAVSGSIEQLLRAELSERPVGVARLAAIAKVLIADMSPPKK